MSTALLEAPNAPTDTQLDDVLDLAPLAERTWPGIVEGLFEGGDPLAASKGHAKIGDHGLLNADRTALARIRRLGVQSAMLGYRNAGAIHYSQQPNRWEGIDRHLRGYKGQFPKHADCSSFATWVLWDAVRAYRPRDFVNGAGWGSGHTGTLVKHGRRVSLNALKVLDLVFYGDEGWRPGHVAIYVGGGKVVSHGSEAGPFLLPVRYRSDVGLWAPRRYVH